MLKEIQWLNIYHECLLDKDKYSVINVIEKHQQCNDAIFYLGTVRTFMRELQNSYKNLQSLMRQLNADFPRIKCFVNGVHIQSYHKLISEFNHTNLLYKATLLCTQTAFYPVAMQLFNEFTDKEQNIHFSDYGGGDNFMMVNFKIFKQNKMSVVIEKKFKIFKIIDDDPTVLKT